MSRSAAGTDSLNAHAARLGEVAEGVAGQSFVEEPGQSSTLTSHELWRYVAARPSKRDELAGKSEQPHDRRPPKGHTAGTDSLTRAARLGEVAAGVAEP